MRVASALLAAALCLPTPSRAAPPEAGAGLDARSLVAGLVRPPPARTAYTEVRWSNLLERPLVLRGELEYLGPGQLGKRVDTPYREQMTVADGQAKVQRGDAAARTFSLGQAPELEGFLRGFAALLGGDADALSRVLVNDLQRASIELAPGLRDVLGLGEACGAIAGIVSGSGPTVALLAHGPAAAEGLAGELRHHGLDAQAVHGPVHGARIISDTLL